MDALQNLTNMNIGFIGGGNMASAIGAGLIRKGILNADNVWVSGKTNRSFEFWNDLGAHTTLNNAQVVENSDIIFLSMKPPMLDDALAGIANGLSKKVTGKLYVSVLVGVTLNVLYSKLSAILPEPRIVRTMPNTPMMVGEGVIVWCSKGATLEDQNHVNAMFSPLGISEKVEEYLMNPIGGLTSSAPAYAYLITEALADGAVKMGVPRALATKFSAQVLVGAGKMVLQTGRHPGQLKDEVCSPGGTTITGMYALEQGGVRGALMNAVESGVKRSEELAAAMTK
ncbi:pyrroline-5-carboxylate reductase [Athalia rosae]|uniref:pyrroline-5-carboxylate reductase n=1 Tax=Athalia rosae TaxID=37344 RepID=UPI0020341307|nr:pyrroline-5-carboxylate reductase [Athalia rosae]XP_048512915.1 pyrroline-5-carboxylate reductase [Athalia rosae]